MAPYKANFDDNDEYQSSQKTNGYDESPHVSKAFDDNIYLRGGGTMADAIKS